MNTKYELRDESVSRKVHTNSCNAIPEALLISALYIHSYMLSMHITACSTLSSSFKTIFSFTTQPTCLEQSSFHPNDVASVLLCLLCAEGPTSHNDLNAFLFFLCFFVRHSTVTGIALAWPWSTCFVVNDQGRLSLAVENQSFYRVCFRALWAPQTM